MNIEPNSFSSFRAFENLIAHREKSIMEDKSRLNREIEKEEQENEIFRETFVEFQSDLEIKERELQSMKNELQELQQNVKRAKFKNQNHELQLFNKEKEKNEESVKLKGQLTTLQRKQRALVQQNSTSNRLSVLCMIMNLRKKSKLIISITSERKQVQIKSNPHHTPKKFGT